MVFISNVEYSEREEKREKKTNMHVSWEMVCFQNEWLGDTIRYNKF